MCLKLHRQSILVLTMLLAVIIGAAAFSPLLFAQRGRDTAGSSAKPSAPAIVTIPTSKNLFEPFILPVKPGTTVIWQNDDAQAHPFMTTPDHNTFLNRQRFSFNVAAGKSVRFTFTQPGLYHYFETRLDSWNSSIARVRAGEKKINYPLAMDGVIWVQGSIANLPSITLNSVLDGHDEFASEFIAINRDGTITWHNFDQDAHFIGEVAGWTSPVNPADMGLYRLAGTDEVPGGEFATVLFHTPGLYYYYCRNHDYVDPIDNRAYPLAMASEFPIPMEGFVLVV